MCYKIIYFTRPNGKQPAQEWINDTRNANLQPSIDARIQKLNDEGLVLVNTEILKPIKGDDNDLYELRHQGKGKKWRIAVYYDRKKNVFVLLCGWRKTQEKQESYIERARRLLHEYLDMQEVSL